MRKKELSEIITKAYKDLRETHDVIAEKSFLELVKSRRPGEYIPDRGEIHGKAWKDAFEESRHKYKSIAVDALNKYGADIEEKITIAPTEEAVRAVQMFSMKPTDKIDPNSYANEIDSLMNKYGSNYLTYETLRGLAVSHGIRDFKEHPLKTESDFTENLSHYIDSAFVEEPTTGSRVALFETLEAE